jgi:hypothetical protein
MTTNANAITSTSNWGFKTPIQFRVALRLAGAFGHLWAEGRGEYICTRIPMPGGAVKLQEKWVRKEPQTPAEAAQWAEEAPNQMGAAYTVPTPSWESGSGSFKVLVAPNGATEMTLDGVLIVNLSPEGIPSGVKLAANWQLEWTGRGMNMGEALKNAIQTLSGGFRDPYILQASPELAAKAINLFESDRQFWRTGFQVGRRWWI